MNKPDLSKLTPQERRSYLAGVAIVKEKLYQARLEHPTAEELHKRSLSIGISQVREKLARFRNTPKPAPLVPSRKCYSKNGRKILTTGKLNTYNANGRKWLSTGSII